LLQACLDRESVESYSTASKQASCRMSGESDRTEEELRLEVQKQLEAHLFRLDVERAEAGCTREVQSKDTCEVQSNDSRSTGVTLAQDVQDSPRSSGSGSRSAKESLSHAVDEASSERDNADSEACEKQAAETQGAAADEILLNAKDLGSDILRGSYFANGVPACFDWPLYTDPRPKPAHMPLEELKAELDERGIGWRGRASDKQDFVAMVMRARTDEAKLETPTVPAKLRVGHHQALSILLAHSKESSHTSVSNFPGNQVDLDASCNSMGDDGVADVAEALANNTSVTALNLGANGIQAEGAQRLAEALLTNQTLTDLNLRGNNIGSRGAEFLAEALEHNTTLTALNLGGNGIMAAGAKRLAEALKVNESLRSLVLKTNALGHESVSLLSEAVKASGITHFDLRGLNVGHKDRELEVLGNIASMIESKQPRLILSIARSSSGEISCTTLGGRVLATQKPTDSLASLSKAAAAEAGHEEDVLRFMRPDGECISDPDGKRTLADLLTCDAQDLTKLTPLSARDWAESNSMGHIGRSFAASPPTSSLGSPWSKSPLSPSAPWRPPTPLRRSALSLVLQTQSSLGRLMKCPGF